MMDDGNLNGNFDGNFEGNFNGNFDEILMGIWRGTTVTNVTLISTVATFNTE